MGSMNLGVVTLTSRGFKKLRPLRAKRRASTFATRKKLFCLM
jgi:hypothetical protein